MLISKLYCTVFLFLAWIQVRAFVPVATCSSPRKARPTFAGALPPKIDLFAEEPELLQVAENYVRCKYKQCIKSKNSEFMTKEDAREVLRSVLPPVTPSELDDEVLQTLTDIMDNEDKIDEDRFVKGIMQNSYWKAAGDLVVLELMFLDALYSYYRTGTSLLQNDDYEAIKENLTWEGSSVATMNKQEALFVTAVVSSRRGDPIMKDEEYQTIKSDLKRRGSWVTARAPDALERLGLNTFMGYLHRAL